MKDLKIFEEAIVSYGMHLAYVRQMLITWSSRNKITPNDWNQLVAAILEYGTQLEWKS